MSSESTGEVSFYYIKSGDQQKKFHIACRLAMQAYDRVRKPVYIRVDSIESAETLDRMLWDFPQRFIPHVIGEKPTEPRNLIRIGTEVPPDWHYLLINLTREKTRLAGLMDRLFEVVLPDEREAARERYAHYDNLKCELREHQI